MTENEELCPKRKGQSYPWHEWVPQITNAEHGRISYRKCRWCERREVTHFTPIVTKA